MCSLYNLLSQPARERLEAHLGTYDPALDILVVGVGRVSHSVGTASRDRGASQGRVRERHTSDDRAATAATATATATARRLGGSATWVAAGWAAAATVTTVAAATATTVAEARAEAVATAAVARAAMEEEEAANAPSLWRDHREGREGSAGGREEGRRQRSRRRTGPGEGAAHLT